MPKRSRASTSRRSGRSQSANANIPRRSSTNAGPALLVEVDEHLGVALRRELVPGALEPLAQLAVVVDLAVVDDLDAAVLVADRLVAAREVDDRQAPRRKRDAALDERAGAVGAAVHERVVHRLDDARVDGRAVERQQAADATHGS